MLYKIEMHHKNVYALADIQNPQSEAQNMMSPKQTYFSRGPKRKYAPWN